MELEADMNTWTRTGPVVVEIDGSVEALRVVDYAALEAIQAGAELVIAAPYQPHGPLTPVDQQLSPAEFADAVLRRASAHVRHRYGRELAFVAVSEPGSRLRVLPQVAKQARLLVVPRISARGPQRLVAAQSNLFLAARAGCPVIVVPTSWRPSEADRRLVVGIDGSPVSAEAVEFAFRTAAERGGELMVVHAQRAPRHDRDGAEQSWVQRAELTVAETMAGWADEFPRVPVTRFLTARPVVDALVHEGAQAGLVVIGARGGQLPLGDPVARRTVAALTCPVAIVPHQVTVAELDQQARRIESATGVVVPTY